jgi:hypothetical protein
MVRGRRFQSGRGLEVFAVSASSTRRSVASVIGKAARGPVASALPVATSFVALADEAAHVLDVVVGELVLLAADIVTVGRPGLSGA